MRSWRPVSYTHLDVYKRQILNGKNASADLAAWLQAAQVHLNGTALEKTKWFFTPSEISENLYELQIEASCFPKTGKYTVSLSYDGEESIASFSIKKMCIRDSCNACWSTKGSS